MKTRLAVVLLLGAAFASVGVAVGGDAKAELKKFAGTWAVESVRKSGKDIPAGEAEMVTFLFAGNKVTVRKGDTNQEGTFTINPSKKPRQITLTTMGKKAPGIYAFEGGKLKICVGQPGEERPTEFKSAEGSKTVLIVLKRAKK